MKVTEAELTYVAIDADGVDAACTVNHPGSRSIKGMMRRLVTPTHGATAYPSLAWNSA